MTDKPAVLVLVTDDDRREEVHRRLIELEVHPISVGADCAADAVTRYHPISVVIDDSNAAAAPDDFLETACSLHVRLVSLIDYGVGSLGDADLRNAVAPRPAA